MSPHDYGIYRDTTRAFESVGAITTRGYNLTGTAEPVRVTCGRVTDNLLPLLGIQPFRGRWFEASEDRDRANHVIIISFDSWQARFGGDESILGKTISLDLTPYRVVGIMPRSFSFPPQGVQGLTPSECWVPAGFSPTMPHGPRAQRFSLARTGPVNYRVDQFVWVPKQFRQPTL